MKNKIFVKKLSRCLFFLFLTNIAQPIMCHKNEISSQEPTSVFPDQINKEKIGNDLGKNIETNPDNKLDNNIENLIKDDNFDYKFIDPFSICAAEQKQSTKLPFAFEECNLDQDLSEIILRSAPQEIKNLIKNYESRQKKIKPFPVPKQIVLYGPCGTGKSDMGKLIANKFGKKGLIVRCSLLGSEWKNSENANLTREIDAAIENVKKCYDGGSSAVIILEEIDSLLKEDQNKQPGDASMASLLDGLMKMPAILIFTTNDISCISSRFKDRCCYQTMIEVPRPDPAVQVDIINYFINKANKDFEEDGFSGFKINKLTFDLTKIIKSYDFSIRKLKALFDNALMEALKRENSRKITFSPIDFKIANNQITKSTGKIEKEKSRKEFLKLVKEYGPTVLGIIGAVVTVASITIQVLSNMKINKQQQEALSIQKESIALQQIGMNLQKEGMTLQKDSVGLQNEGLKESIKSRYTQIGLWISGAIAGASTFVILNSEKVKNFIQTAVETLSKVPANNTTGFTSFKLPKLF